jgi:drug/metabolite transporter (DMT)-like permease
VGYGVYTHARIPSNLHQWELLSAISFISNIVAIVAFFAGLKIIGPVKASMISTLELVTTITFSFWLLKEKMGVMQIIGSVFILLASILLAKETNSD